MDRALENAIIYLQWFILTAIAYPVGALAGAAIALPLGVEPESTGYLLLTGFVSGVLIAVAQLLLLRRQTVGSEWWILLTAVCVTLGSWLSALILEGSVDFFMAILAGTAGAMLPAVLQVTMLRSMTWTRIEWVVLTFSAWIFAYGVGEVVISGGRLDEALTTLGHTQTLAMIGWAIGALIAVLLLLFFTPIARRRELSGRIQWLP
jgi:hypothetical protein